MKRLIYVVAAALMAGLAIAQTSTVAPPVDKGYQAMRGTSNIGAIVASEAACEKIIQDWAAADARHSTKPATTNFSCNGKKVYVAKTTPPPVCAAQPLSTATTKVCGSGFEGSITTTLTYTKALTPTSCTWTELSTVTGSCVVKVEPPPPTPNPNPEPPVDDMPKGTVIKVIPTKLNQNPIGGWSKDMLIPTTEVAPSSDIGAFRTGCQVSKYAYDDPIVFPGQPGKSHLHTFFGNTGVDAYSTATSLFTTGNSTCRGGTINRSAYWVPSMVDVRTGTVLAPMFESNFYYKTGYALPPSSITEIPMGLRMIAGDPKGNPSAPSSAAIYACVWNGGNSDWSSSIPKNCPGGDGSWLIMGIDFPQCWDGINLDSPDHKSHMTNPVNVKANNTGNCPASHPVAMPQIAYQILYQVKVTGETANWRLSSDAYDATKPAGFSGHGDYFMAWKPEIVKVWTKNCDNAQKDCHSHLLGDGRAMVIP